MKNEIKNNAKYAIEPSEKDEQISRCFSIEQREFINECMVNELKRELKYVVE